jgi:hypothetical protein
MKESESGPMTPPGAKEGTMTGIVALVGIFATPGAQLPALPDTPIPYVADDVDPETKWIEDMLRLLDWLCEIFGGDFCNSEAGLAADPHMITFITQYADSGVPSDLTDTERFRARSIVEDLYDHLQTPMSGTQSVIDAMNEALISAYEELGGDPGDL